MEMRGLMQTGVSDARGHNVLANLICATVCGGFVCRLLAGQQHAHGMLVCAWADIWPLI